VTGERLKYIMFNIFISFLVISTFRVSTLFSHLTKNITPLKRPCSGLQATSLSVSPTISRQY